MIIIITLASDFYKKERNRNNNNNHIYAIAAETEGLKDLILIAMHCPKQCINTLLILINSLILINTDEIIVNPDLETIYLPQVAAAYKDAICNFIQAIS